MALIGDGRAIIEVAHSWGVSRHTLHDWLARYGQPGSPRDNSAGRTVRDGSVAHQVEPARKPLKRSRTQLRPFPRDDFLAGSSRGSAARLRAPAMGTPALRVLRALRAHRTPRMQ